LKLAFRDKITNSSHDAYRRLVRISQPIQQQQQQSILLGKPNN